MVLAQTKLGHRAIWLGRETEWRANDGMESALGGDVAPMTTYMVPVIEIRYHDFWPNFDPEPVANPLVDPPHQTRWLAVVGWRLAGWLAKTHQKNSKIFEKCI